jgi:hypothetical protein
LTEASEQEIQASVTNGKQVIVRYEQQSVLARDLTKRAKKPQGVVKFHHAADTGYEITFLQIPEGAGFTRVELAKLMSEIIRFSFVSADRSRFRKKCLECIEKVSISTWNVECRLTPKVDRGRGQVLDDSSVDVGARITSRNV